VISTRYIDNKYRKWYFSIIENAKNTIYDSNFHEKHHIIPLCFGGSNNIENLAVLTFREHFVCHWLLIKFTSSSDKGKMSNALRMMMNKSSTNKRVLTNKQYEIARTVLSKNKRTMSEKFKKKQKENNLGNLNPMFGKKQSEKQKHKARETMLLLISGNQKSIIKQKIIESNKKRKGLKQKTTICPFCEKIGSVSNMKRWHFNNCKEAA
jgi:hypothetical protein